VDLILRNSRVLAIGAHPDDVEFGCFGALAVASEVSIAIMSRGEKGGDPATRVSEARKSAELVRADLTVLDHPDTRFIVPDIVASLEQIVLDTNPSVVLTMSDQDLHQDHQAVAIATQIALRSFDGPILAYGTPSSIDKFSPNVILGLSKSTMTTKLQAIQLHRSQEARQYMQAPFVESIAKYWAAMSRTDSEYGEPFRLVRWYSTATTSD
jgi:two-component system, NtrC family, response regulator HydG